MLRLLLDEDVRVVLAEILRSRGYDTRHVLEERRAGRSDQEQLEFAASQGRAILTHNIRDFIRLDRAFRFAGKEHCGIVVSDQVLLGELLRRVLRLLSRRSEVQVRNRVVWLHDFASSRKATG